VGDARLKLEAFAGLPPLAQQTSVPAMEPFARAERADDADDRVSVFGASRPIEPSDGEATAIHGQHGPVNEAGLLGSEEGDGRGDLFGPPDATGRSRCCYLV
jgi:hypothetical protein